MLEGMDVARINFSHGTYEEHLKRIEAVKKLRAELGLPVALLLDTKGPEIRIGRFEKGPVELKEGETFTLTLNECRGDNCRVFVSTPQLADNLKPGTDILLDDGLIRLSVEKIQGPDIL